MKRAGWILLVAIAIAFAIWTECRGDDPAISSVRYRDPRTMVAPRRVAPGVAIAADADGSLRLEGRVIGRDGRGVQGAAVTLDPTSSRTATTASDGGFSFDHLERPR